MWRISRPNPDLLHVTEWPHPVEVLMALLFAGFGLYAGLFSLSTGSEVVLRCHRQPDGTGICRVVQQGPVRHRDRQFPLAQIYLEAEAETSSDGEPISWLRVKGGGRSETLALYSGHDAHARALTVVRRFERFKAGRLGNVFVHRKDDRSITRAFGYGFMAFGMLPFLLFGVRRTVIDRHTRRLTICRWGLLSWKVLQAPLAEVRRVHLAETTDSEGDTSYCLQVVLTSGRAVPVVNAQSSRPTPLEPLAQAVAAMLESG